MTGKDVFERAMDLCALRGENDARSEDTADLRERATGLLNVLLSELHPLNERLIGRKRPIQELYSLEETLDICDAIGTGLIPYALAALLIAQEDTELYTVLRSHAQEVKAALLRDGVSRRHHIVEVYG